MYVDSNAAAKTYVMPVDISYESLDGDTYEAEDNVNIPVGQVSQIDIISQSVSREAMAGSMADYSIEFVNSGKVAVSNFKAYLKGDSPVFDNQVYYIGTFDIGATDVFSGSIFPEMAGELNGAIVFTYDDNGEEIRSEYPFSIMVEEMPPMEPMDPGMMEPMMPEEPQSLGDTVKKILIVAAIVLAVGIGGAVGYRKHKKKKEEEELLND